MEIINDKSLADIISEEQFNYILEHSTKDIFAKLNKYETDIKVEQKLGIGGGTSNIHPAMEKGEIEIEVVISTDGKVLKKEVLKEDDKEDND